MTFVSRYQSHLPDAQGRVTYSDSEHAIWEQLYRRQRKVIPERACNEFLDGLNKLDLRPECIPQLPEISERLLQLTGWKVTAVAALISAREFFQLLAQRCFPAATFIRCAEELDYVTEPDIFHELFGHCPMLTHPVYADFIYQYACRVLHSPEKDWPLLQRLFWYTVEFGLIKTSEGLRAYGGGILSSISETPYSIESDLPLRALFHPLVALRTPYRIDRLQPVYFVIDDYQTLYNLLIDTDLTELMQRARELGEFPPFFPVEQDDPNIHILAC
ncbi:MAG: phenylalanine 4-monooxygenase [Legionella sp.]|nr:phenylalanine 4-monooxygenase [Legionella sp.]